MRALTLIPAALLAGTFLSGCDALAIYNYVQVGGYQPTIADIPYGAHPRQRLDIYLPVQQSRPAPLLVWFYGGSWASGDKSGYAFIARRFTAMGYAVAIHDYRLVPEVQFPAFVTDGALALRHLRDFALRHPQDIDARSMVLAGHSAGAYNAVQLVADPAYLQQVGLRANDIEGIIGLSGPYDFYPYAVDATREAFGDTPASASQPVARDLSHMPPLLLLAGSADATVKPRNSMHLADAAPDARLLLVDGMDHIGTLLAIGQRLTTKQAVLEPIRDFLSALQRPRR
ncbi:MAG: alpha/beta hydrolase [Halioglobus sp.]|nr:alpha/beta hydrolase [Halioglobus sp.]